MRALVVVEELPFLQPVVKAGVLQVGSPVKPLKIGLVAALDFAIEVR